MLCFLNSHQLCEWHMIGTRLGSVLGADQDQGLDYTGTYSRSRSGLNLHWIALIVDQGQG